MKCIDITNELFATPRFGPDPGPELDMFRRMPELPCNQSTIKMNSHNGTHMDAPLHFIQDGNDILTVHLEDCFGPCSVKEASGTISGEQMKELLKGCHDRLLLKGDACVSAEAAQLVVDAGIRLIGTDCYSMTPADDFATPHVILLSAGVVILESLSLNHVKPGRYTVCAFPLKIAGAEATNIRAVLLQD